MPGELVRSTAVALTRGRIRIKEYEDGSLRIQVMTPIQLVISEAYLVGSPTTITLTNAERG